MRYLSQFFASSLFLAATTFAQGPLVLMGIDAEDGGVGAHGPIASYLSVITNGNGTGLLNNVSNGGSGILVLGGGKSATDDVTEFWDEIDNLLGGGVVTYVNGANLGTQSFAGFALLAVVSDVFNTPGGGLTNAEMALLAGRSGDVATHINGGGGLLGFTSADLANPYAYLAAVGAFTFNSPAQFNDITPTPAGLAIGITNQLDVCCWHDEYVTFPGFLDVLATNAATGTPCAIGGVDVLIVEGIVLTPLNSTCPTGSTHPLTATVADSLGNPIAQTLVTFTVIAGPNAGVTGQAFTDANGVAQFSYTGNSVGIDTVEACFVDGTGATVCAQATKEWTGSPECFLFAGVQEGAVALGPDLDDILRVLPIVAWPVSQGSVPSLYIPNIPALVGTQVIAQVGMFNTVAFPNNPLQFSNALRVTVGVDVQSVGYNQSISLSSPPLPALGQNFPFWFTILSQ